MGMHGARAGRNEGRTATAAWLTASVGGIVAMTAKRQRVQRRTISNEPAVHRGEDDSQNSKGNGRAILVPT